MIYYRFQCQYIHQEYPILRTSLTYSPLKYTEAISMNDKITENYINYFFNDTVVHILGTFDN